MGTKARGGGVKALVAGPLKKELFFCGFSYLNEKILEGDGVFAQQLVGIRGHKRHAEQAAQVVGSRSRRDLNIFF